MQLEKGSATVPVAAIGVLPMASNTASANQRWGFRALDQVGGTPTSARETRALPIPNRDAKQKSATESAALWSKASSSYFFLASSSFAIQAVGPPGM
jgi:hypothetical protein